MKTKMQHLKIYMIQLTVFRRQFIAVNVYTKKEENIKLVTTFCLKIQEESKLNLGSRKKGMIKITAKSNEIKIRITIRKTKKKPKS